MDTSKEKVILNGNWWTGIPADQTLALTNPVTCKGNIAPMCDPDVEMAMTYYFMLKGTSRHGKRGEKQLGEMKEFIRFFASPVEFRVMLARLFGSKEMMDTLHHYHDSEDGIMVDSGIHHTGKGGGGRLPPMASRCVPTGTRR